MVSDWDSRRQFSESKQLIKTELYLQGLFTSELFEKVLINYHTVLQ